MTVDLAAPLSFAEFVEPYFNPEHDALGCDAQCQPIQYAQVRLCTKRHPGEYIDHFFKSYTYVSNGAHVDMRIDGIIRIHYVETFDALRAIDPKHHALPENAK